MCQSLSTDTSTSESERIFFNNKYYSALDTIVKSALDEYNQSTYVLRKIQYSTIKTYMWLSTVVFASELSFYADIAGNKQFLKFINLNIETNSKVFIGLTCLSL